MKDILEKASKLEAMIDEMLGKTRDYQFFLRGLNTSLLSPDVSLIEFSSAKNFFKSLISFLVWQVKFRFFKEKFFEEKKAKTINFLFSLDFISRIKI